MSSIAYQDKAKTMPISARQAKLKNKGEVYYCFNRQCNAELYFAHTSGVEGGHFRAFPSRKHNPDCDQACSGSNVDPYSYNEKEFDINNLIDRFSKSSSKKHDKNQKEKQVTDKNSLPNPQETRTIRTISQLYFLLKAFTEKQKYNGFTVGFMLIDGRSRYMNTRGVWGKKLVEAKVSKGYFYNNDLKEIYLEIPRDDEYKFILKFDDIDLYLKIRLLIYENRDYFIVVSGNWNKEKANTFYSKITSKKQLYIVKNRQDENE
ncbi:hypothetical protein [Bibersteinia trehalosi]|uniref:hypothetical protein n=1 Tax=Bibersteinia trehalosi TaxID=47735 RepID=UPI002D7777F1|nr:hypothetical protein [Bibersteinia trehalosi]